MIGSNNTIIKIKYNLVEDWNNWKKSIKWSDQFNKIFYKRASLWVWDYLQRVG